MPIPDDAAAELRQLHDRYHGAQLAAARLIAAAKEPLVTRVAEVAESHSYDEIARVLPVSRSMVGLYVQQARELAGTVGS